MTCNKEHLVGYVYEELSGAERAAFRAHLSACANCRRELADLQEARHHLTTWAPPEPELSFQVVRGAAAPAAISVQRRRFAAFVPAWAVSAAAGLLLVAGAAAVANLEVRYGAGGLVVRTGWTSSAAPEALPQATAPAVTPAGTAAPAVSTALASEQVARQLEALTRRLRELEQAQSSSPAKATAPTPAVITAPELRRILIESEARQRTEMALQVSQIWKDFNAARVSDFSRIQDAVSRAQGMTNQQLRQHRDSIESLYRTASQR